MPAAPRLRAVTREPLPSTVERRRRRQSMAEGLPLVTDERLETAADGAADAALRGTPLGPTARGAKRFGPAQVHAIDGAGRPLETALRSDAERRFGHDFSRVRIHSDAEAGRSADAWQAFAYTAGDHLVFGPGLYAPATAAGKRLLFHELAHVIQQSHFPAPSIQRQAKLQAKPPAKFYQEVIDLIAADRRQMTPPPGGAPVVQVEPSNFQTLKRLLALCEAVDQQNAGAIPQLVDELIAGGLQLHLATVSEELLTELSVRLHRLNLAAEATKLRDAYAKEKKAAVGLDLGKQARTLALVTRLIDLAIAEANTSTMARLLASLDKFVVALIPLRDAYSEIDWAELQQSRSRRGDLLRQPLAPAMRTVDYYEKLIDEFQRLFGGMEALLQTAIDGARADFEARKADGSVKLSLLNKWLQTQLKPAVAPGDPKKDIAHLRIKVIHVDLPRAGSGTIRDAFLTGRAADKRSVRINTYDPSQTFVPDQESTVEQLFRARVGQIFFLARLYGDVPLATSMADRDAAKATAADAEANKAAIADLPQGRMRLDSDDDWRSFALKKFEQATDPRRGNLSADDALDSVISLLFAYLQAFTIHAHAVNIYDFDVDPRHPDPYINKAFPRDLSGRLVHDCGVYAVRVAYILSGIRHKLGTGRGKGMRVRLVFLPAHVALVAEGPGLSTYIFENNFYTRVSPARVKAIAGEYANSIAVTVDPQGQTVESPKDADQLVGEMAAIEYISAPADMPFRLVDIADFPDARTAQQQLWKTYTENAKPNKDLFGAPARTPGDPDFLFHQRYLALTEAMRAAYNSTDLPFWNETAPTAWTNFEQALSKEGRTDIRPSELLPLLSAYRTAYSDALKPVLAQKKSIDSQAFAIGAEFRRNPKLKADTARLSNGPRAATMLTNPAIDYADVLSNYLNEIAKSAANDQRITVEEVKKRISPPFMPRDQNRRYPLE